MMTGRAGGARRPHSSDPGDRRPTRSTSRRPRRRLRPRCPRESRRCRVSTSRGRRSPIASRVAADPRIARAYGIASAVGPAPVVVATVRARARGTRRRRRCARGRIGSRPCWSVLRDRGIGGLDRGADPLGALRNLGWDGQSVPIVERLAGVMLTVRVRCEREHDVAVPRVARCACPRPASIRRYPCSVPQLTVSVWNVDLLQPISVVDALRTWLDDDEIRAAARAARDVLRHRYVVAHGAVRSILGSRLGIAPGAVVLVPHLRSVRRCAARQAGARPTTPTCGSACRTRSRSRWLRVAVGARVGCRHRDRAPASAARPARGRACSPTRSTPNGSKPSLGCASTRSSNAGPRRRRISRRPAPASGAAPRRAAPTRGWTVSRIPIAARHRRELRGRSRRARGDRAVGAAGGIRPAARHGSRQSPDRQVPRHRGRRGARGGDARPARRARAARRTRRSRSCRTTRAGRRSRRSDRAGARPRASRRVSRARAPVVARSARDDARAERHRRRRRRATQHER